MMTTRVGMESRKERAAMEGSEVDQAIRFLAARLQVPIRMGIVLGSGLGGLVDLIDVRQVFTYEEIPGWPEATALGHAGNLVLGRLGGVEVAALQGRLHLYEGHTREAATRPIAVLSQLGATGWVISNAAGGLHPNFRCGDLMAITGHLDLSFQVGRRRSLEEPWDPAGGMIQPGRTAGSCYDPQWIELLQQHARRNDVVMHQGCYAMVSGPNYETRAEYRAFRKLGADAVGMSTVPEVCRARRLGARVLGISVITNEAKPDAPIENDADDVIAVAHGAEDRLKKLLLSWIEELSLSDRTLLASRG